MNSYLDNKRAYIKLRSIQSGGGRDKLIIHISGPSGAGKSTLGNKLKTKFKDKIIVKDIDEFVRKNSKKPLIFVGLNHMPWWNKDLYYNMHSNHNYYINIDDEIVFKQKYGRFFDDVFENHREDVFKDLMDSEKDKQTLKNIHNGFRNECNYKEIKSMNKRWNRDYRKQNYEILSRENIFRRVKSLINKEIK